MEQELRAAIDKRIKELTDPDHIAKLELAREFFCNPAFRQFALDLVWELNNTK